MVYALVVLGVLLAGAGGGLLYLWSKYREAAGAASVAGAANSANAVALQTAFDDLKAARSALSIKNEVDNANDQKVASAAPDLDSALSRVNGL